MHRYAPTSLSQITHDAECTDALRATGGTTNLLLTGAPGSGKTTLIRALLRDFHPDVGPADVMFINTLKEQGIQYYRSDVPSFCSTRKHVGKKRVVVIDDVDRINEQNQQAFCCCIDEYSDNVVFLMTCTQPGKVIESIHSRILHVPVTGLRGDVLRAFVQRVCTEEGMRVGNGVGNGDGDGDDGGDGDQVIDQLISVCNGCVKTVLTYVEKFRVLEESHITSALIEDACTNISHAALEQYTRHLIAGNREDALAVFQRIHDQGYSVIDIFDAYFRFVKLATPALLSEQTTYLLVELLCRAITAFSNIHEDDIELLFFTNNAIRIIHTT